MATNRPVNKVKNEARHAKGRAKETVGRTTGDESMEARGLADQAIADLREIAGSVRTMARDMATGTRKKLRGRR